jgi:hypothetical protein
METDFTRQRLSNKAHIFGPDDTLCARCGLTKAEALEAPFRCAGQWKTAPAPKRPMTLTAALNAAEDHIIASRATPGPASEASEGPAPETA